MMKYIAFLFSLIFLFSCENKGKQIGDYISYGKVIDDSGVITQNEMLDKYSTLQPGDTLDLKFKSEIKQVCQMEGCWVRLALDANTESMVYFKNEEFSIPKDSDGKTAIVAGKAFVEEVSVEDQKHLAKDAGKSDEEIATITQPKKEYQFIADGILLQ